MYLNTLPQLVSIVYGDVVFNINNKTGFPSGVFPEEGRAAGGLEYLISKIDYKKRYSQIGPKPEVLIHFEAWAKLAQQ